MLARATIAPLPKPIADYLAGFDLMAIAVSRDGRIVSTRAPRGCTAAWWVEAANAGKIKRWLIANGSRDAVFAGRSLGIALTDHETVVRRAATALGQIRNGVGKAEERGQLKEFNQAYRAHRIAAQAAGRRFMDYRDAKRRLEAAVASAAGKGEAFQPAKLFELYSGRS